MNPQPHRTHPLPVLLALLALASAGCATDEGEYFAPSAEAADEVGSGVVPTEPRIAPDGFRPDALPLEEGRNNVPSDSSVVLFRVDVPAHSHASFQLKYSGSPSGLVLGLERFDKDEPLFLGDTDSGPGIRVLAALPSAVDTTYWVTVASDDGISGATLTLSTKDFEDEARCTSDCRRLLQLPTPDDTRLEGYYSGETSVIRQQFGRRDLLMALRNAGRLVSSEGLAPFQVEDISNWNGTAPPGHASHRNGEDVDIELYADDGINVWRDHQFFCKSSSQRCRAGTVRNFDARATAIMLGGFFESRRVTIVFLDQQLINAVRAEVSDLVASGVLSEFAGDKLKSGTLTHFANHENHAHLRFRDSSSALVGEDELLLDGEAMESEGVYAP